MRIGEAAAASGVTAKTVRFYEQVGLLPAPPRTSGGYRDYSDRTVQRPVFIRHAGSSPCAHVTALIDRHLKDIDRRLAELDATKAVLESLAERATATDPADCTDAEVCRILTRTNSTADGERRH